MNTTSIPKILLIEDNRNDARTIKRLFSEIEEAPPLETIHTGKGAEEYLLNQPQSHQ